MKRTNFKKRGFTIVELVIVIAVIGILSAVLIPTFIGIVQKAKVAADKQLLSSLNQALSMGQAQDGKNNTMYEALLDAKDSGYDVAKINAKATGNEILWDQKNDVFVYYNKEKNNIEYLPENKADALDLSGGNESYKLWKIYNETDVVEEVPTYSVYWNKSTNDIPETLEVGFDAGDNTIIEQVKVNTSKNLDDLIIRTNGTAKVEITAANATVKHYGIAGTVEITEVAGHSYYENGIILDRLYVKKGHVVINETDTTASDKVDIVVQSDEVSVELNANASVYLDSGVTKDSIQITGAAAEEVETTEIQTVTSLNSDMENGYYKLDADISLSQNDDIVWSDKKITLDLNGHTVTFFTPSDENYASQNGTYLLIDGGSNITILDSSAEGTGTMKSELLVAYPLLRVDNASTLTINSGNFKTKSYNSSSSANRSNQNTIDFLDGKLVINGGKFENSRKVPTGLYDHDGFVSGYCINMHFQTKDKVTKPGRSIELEINGGTFTAERSVVVYGSYDTTGTVTINNGTFETGEAAICLYLTHKGLTVISGGNFEGGTCVMIRSGALDIRGGTFNATGNRVPLSVYKSGCQNTGDAIAILVSTDDRYEGKPIVYNISGANITSKNSKAVHVFVPTGSQEPSVNFDRQYSYEITHQE